MYISKILKLCISSSSSSCRAASTDIPDPLSPLLPIIHRLRQVFRVTSCVLIYKEEQRETPGGVRVGRGNSGISNGVASSYSYTSRRLSLLLLIYIYIYIFFSIATTPCSRGCFYFPWIFPLTLDPFFITLSNKQEAIKYHCLSLWYVLARDWLPVSRIIVKRNFGPPSTTVVQLASN